MTSLIAISDRLIGIDYPPYIVAELSANHNGRIETALEIISAAAQSGVDAVKLQTYRPDTITLDSEAEGFVIQGGMWDGRRLYDLYAEAMTPWEWHKPLFDQAHACGVTMFSSPFDSTAVDLLEDLNAPAYKIASFEAVDIPLIRYTASTGKPMIISTGMANADEITEAVAAARDSGCTELALLHCVSGYPAPVSDYNLRTIPDMIARFGLVTGLSDHTLDNTTAIAAVALGASIIEKHITLDRKGKGPDDSFSMEPGEFSRLCADARSAWETLGNADYGLKSSERANIQYRRSIFVIKDMKAGEEFTCENIKSIRPGNGLEPKHLESILGKRASHNILAGTPLSWDLIAG